MKVSSETNVAMPMRNLISIVVAVGLGVWAYFGVVERLNQSETNIILLQEDLKSALVGDVALNTEFRIKWPRGDLGSPPADGEQFMLIEFLSGQVEAIQSQLESMLNNKVNIIRLQTDMDKVLADVEKMKDKIRESNGYKKDTKTGDGG